MRISITGTGKETIYYNVPDSVGREIENILLYVEVGHASIKKIFQPHYTLSFDNLEGNSIVLTSKGPFDISDDRREFYHNIPIELIDAMRRLLDDMLTKHEGMTFKEIATRTSSNEPTGCEGLSDKCRDLAAKGEIDQVDADCMIRLYDFLSTCSRGDIEYLFDSTVFNNIAEKYLTHTLNDLISDETITEEQSKAIQERYHAMLRKMNAEQISDQ